MRSCVRSWCWGCWCRFAFDVALALHTRFYTCCQCVWMAREDAPDGHSASTFKMDLQIPHSDARAHQDKTKRGSCTQIRNCVKGTPFHR